jgi:hypothetical protein
MTKLDSLFYLFATLVALFMLASIYAAIRQLISEFYLVKMNVTEMAINIQELRNKYAPFRTDYRG